MSDNRKYYYLKLKENYFDDDSIVLLESMQDGVLYSNILLKLYLKSLKHGGRLQLDEDIPYTAQMIATIMPTSQRGLRPMVSASPNFSGRRYGGRPYDKWLGTQAKPSHRELLRQAIDKAMERGPEDLNALLKLLQEAGFSARRRGKDIAFRAPGWKNVVCLKTLGDGYGEADLCAALTGERKHVPARRAAPAPAVPKVDLLVDIQAKLRAGKGAGYARWASKFNLKQMAQTLSYLNEHGLMDYKVLSEKTEAATARRSELSEKIKAAEKRMAEIAVLRTHIVNYAKTRDTYTAYRKAGYSAKFRSEHEADILLHQAAKRAFDDLNVKKLPKGKDLQAEYAALLAEKKAAYTELRKARDEARELLTVKANVDRVLQDTRRESAQKKEHEQR